jgi:acetyltransferase
MAGLVRYKRLRERPEGRLPSFAAGRERAGTVVAGAMAAGRAVLTLEETADLLQAYDLPTAPSRIARTPAEAIEAASSLGYPVVVKGLAEGLVHKTDAGAVKVDVRNGDEVAAACRAIAASLASAGGSAAGGVRFQVQSLVRGGHETILGLSHDPQFGPLLMFGLGGIFVEVMKDVVFRVLPITDVEARDMVRSIRGYPILAGSRGGVRADEEFLVEAILRVGQMALECPDIDQVDVNPLIVGPDRSRSCVVDARVRLRADAAARP